MTHRSKKRPFVSLAAATALVVAGCSREGGDAPEQAVTGALDASSSPATSHAKPAPTLVAPASSLGVIRSSFTVAELIAEYPRRANEMRGRKVTVVGQYMGTDKAANEYSIGIATDASAQDVVSITCRSETDLANAQPGDPIEVAGELTGADFPTLAHCAGRKR